jgi:hypothetical protein
MDRDVDAQFWRELCSVVDREHKRLNRQLGKIPKLQFSDALIVKMYLWALWFDRCLSWACQLSHYGRLFRPRKVPSISQFSRRVRSGRVELLLEKVFLAFAGAASPSGISYLDGKPLPVSSVSKDPQAARGHVAGGFAKGYKLHAWIDGDRRILRFAVMPLNQSEPPVARAILQAIAPMDHRALVLADSIYDGHELFALLASKNLGFLPALRGIPKHPKAIEQSTPLRIEAVKAWQEAAGVARYVYKSRMQAESVFGELVSTGGLLGPLPAWARGLARVRRWVGGKLILYNARWRIKRGAKDAA